jgi:hypothetical protein
MPQTTFVSCPNQLTAVSSSLNFEVAKLRSMIVACLLAVAVTFALLFKGCEFDGGRPADAYFSQNKN